MRSRLRERFGYADAFGIRVFIFEWRCFGH